MICYKFVPCFAFFSPGHLIKMSAGADQSLKAFNKGVAAEKVMREVIEKTNEIQRKQWPKDWGFIVPICQEMYKQMDHCKEQTLPEKILMVDREDYARFEPKPEDKKSLPPTETKMYGWKVSNSPVEPTNQWVQSHPKISMYKELGWHWDSQH